MSRTIDFFFDPVCPFCWVTSKWVRQVRRLEKSLEVHWRFISLAILNEERDQAGKDSHRLGLGLLRVADAVEEAEGNEAVGRYYEELGNLLWETAPEGVAGPVEREERGRVTAAHQKAVAGDLTPVLEKIGVGVALASASDDVARDAALRRSTAEALRRTGPDVGTPIISFDPPDGPAFFGPVISQLADDEQAMELWDALTTLARYPSFAEIKRSLRATPQTVLSETLRGA